MGVVLTSLVLGAVVWCLVKALQQLYVNWKILPPGPWGLPVVGYIPFMPNKPFHLFIDDVAKKYGPVCSVKIGEATAVILSRIEDVQAVFKLEEMANTHDNAVQQAMKDAGERSFIFANGPFWKLHRKIGVKALSMFSTLRNTRMDAIIHQSAVWLLNEIKKTEGKPVRSKEFYVKVTSANTAGMVFGHTPNPNDKLNLSLVKFVDDLQNVYTPQFITAFLFPTLTSLFSKKLTVLKEFMKNEFCDPLWNIIVSREFNPNVDCISDALEQAVRETEQAKKDQILGNIYTHNYNPTVFEEPRLFKPERFLTEEGKFDQDAASHILSFGTGKRRCPGEMLAKQHLFMLLAILLQNYDVTVSADTKGEPVYEIKETPTVGAGEHKIVFSKRK